jgi:hypothetical protein
MRTTPCLIIPRNWYVRPFSLFLVALLIRPAVTGANDVTPPQPPPRPAIIGFADTHLHQFANLGFGGLEVWGSPMDPSFNICVLHDQTRVHRAGSTVPIRLQVCDAANTNVSSASIVLTATGVTQLSTSTMGAPEDAGNSNPDDEFRFSGGAYIFNLKTTGLSTGAYALTFTATGDPNPHQVQFQVR